MYAHGGLMDKALGLRNFASEALVVYNQMITNNVNLDLVIIIIILYVCSMVRHWDFGRKIMIF